MSFFQNNLSKGQKVFLILIAVIAFAIAFTPQYLVTAIIHGEPNIDDYKIFSNRFIEAGEHQPWQIDESYSSFELSNENRQILEKYKPVAFLIIQNKKIRYEEYWDSYDEHSISNSFSGSKSIVSLLIGIALDEGIILSLDQLVGDFIPEFTEGKKGELSIRHLLTMSSGLSWDEAYSSPFSVTTRAYYGTNLPQLINSLEIITPPGKEFNYLSSDIQVLTMLLENATGKSISEYASEKLWKKIGAQHDALWSLDHENGLEKAFCCFNSNARDFARFGQLILNQGKWNGQQIVSKNYLKEATSPLSYLVDKVNQKAVDFYGFQWWIIDYKGHHIPYMRGILGQYVFAIPEKNAVIVRLGHERSSKYIGQHTKDIYECLDVAFQLLD